MSNNIHLDKTKKKFLKRKRRITPKAKLFINPSITHFNSDSFFIFDIDEGARYLNSNKNPNSLKLSKNEIMTLINVIKSIKNEQIIQSGFKMISVKKSIIDKINDFFNISIKRDPLESFIIKKFEDPENRNNITCRKLAEEYYEKTEIKVSKSTINNIVNKKLGYKYIKTAFKNIKILSEENIITSLSFLKIMERCIRLNFQIIYLDESSIVSCNTKGYAWRKRNQDVYIKLHKNERINLIMAITKDNVIHYSFNRENTNESNFINFIDQLYDKINQQGIHHYVIVMDNLSTHKTSKLLSIYAEKKMNIIFNTPYLSSFNCIEYAYKKKKKKIYTKIYEGINDVIENSSKFIESNEFKNSLKKNYRDTLENYVTFSEKYKNYNLKHIDN